MGSLGSGKFSLFLNDVSASGHMHISAGALRCPRYQVLTITTVIYVYRCGCWKPNQDLCESSTHYSVLSHFASPSGSSPAAMDGVGTTKIVPHASGLAPCQGHIDASDGSIPSCYHMVLCVLSFHLPPPMASSTG